VLDISSETFFALAVRRAKYLVAIALSAVLFCTLGWMLAAPLPQMDGVSLLMWQHHGLVGAMGLAALLLAVTAVCTFLVHPDSPHMGLLCALLGMAGLAIRGGSIHLLIQMAQHPELHPQLPAVTYARLAGLLAVECAQWALIVLLADVFARTLHDRLFPNMHWITRSAPDLAESALTRTRPGLAVLGVSLAVSKALRTNTMRRRVATPLAMLYAGAVAWLLLYVLMQSQHKGQVLMACLVAFGVATASAYLAFPRVPLLALLLVVPLTAAAGYLYAARLGIPAAAGGPAGGFPGQAGFFMMRALPIDYVVAGVPGAIWGYYWAFRWSLTSHE
jgi:hypothetical protein